MAVRPEGLTAEAQRVRREKGWPEHRAERWSVSAGGAASSGRRYALAMAECG